jgi:hypothetical protein
MPEGMTLNIAKGQYPQLEDMGDNNRFSFSGEGTVEWQGENGTITFNSFDIETENTADKELRGLKGTSSVYEETEDEGI